ncbi:MAG TPA: glycosyltransferase family 1 protein [Anaerolineae bacterium]|nr:glycosyltransferase family 1 protein [Anaerolineae bacterium]
MDAGAASFYGEPVGANAPRWPQARVAILGPFPPRPGGVAIQCAILADALTQAGAQVTRINTDLPTWRGEGWRKPLFPSAQVVHLLRALRRTREAWDTLHVHAASWWGFMPAVVGLFARRWGKRLVLTYHGGEAAAFMAQYGPFARRVIMRYHALLTLTPTQAAIFTAHDLAPRIVPNIVPLARFHFRARGPVAPHLLWLRHLEPRYRPEDALAVFARIREAFPQGTLTMVGGGTLSDHLRREVKRMGLTGVRFVGPVPMSQLPAIYDAADIFLNTSAVDNLPLTLIEASASGLPIVSTDAGAIPDLIQDGKNGLLAPIGDAEALAEAVWRLLSDADLARRLSLAARENAARFDWPAIAPLLAQAYGLL